MESTAPIPQTNGISYFGTASSIKGNEKFQRQIEFSHLTAILVSDKRKRLLIQISLFVSLQSVNIASILLSAQSMDTLFISLFGKTCGLGIYPQSGFYCVDQQGDYNSPFGTNYMVVTLGFLMTLVMVVPLGIFSLADNIKVQIASFVGLIAILSAWFITFFEHGLTPSYVPDFGNDMSQVIGTVLFNYAFIVTVPSWVNDLDPKVPIQRSVFYSILISTLNYVSIGIIGGMAFPINQNSDIISVINQSNERNWLTVSSTYIFPVAVLITSIPVYTIVIRYNLIRSGHCKKGLAVFLSSVLPWIVVLPFQTGSWLTVFVNWTNLFFSSISNFVVPFYLYYLSQKPTVAVQAEIKLKKIESDIKRQASVRSTKSDKSFKNVKDWINSQVITRERLRDGTDAAVGILYNDDDYYNVSTPGTPNSLNPNAEHLHVPGRRIVSAPPTTSKSDPQERDNHSRPALSLQMPPSIVHRSNLSRRASPPKENGNNQDIIVELDGSQSHSHTGSDKSPSEKSDSIIFDTPPERFKALPLPDNVRLWIAYICNAGALLTVISVILYDFVELALGRNVFD
ncbi:24956_t:CDS:2 [Dentiscutata erythropus]|uniref:24956_t:CDS:1 n=1 Tax=Dentiscutata erythropus TaxID=1348616 RepID=A0A9N9B9E6_9GLOM|nr:24956_t:CDS:2 [Dentiscutata erythropus]